MKTALFGKILTFLLLLVVATDLGLAPRAQRRQRKPNPPEPYRLGIHHPHPALCPGQEPSQRDLRVLRLAFDVGRYSRQWRNLPWFYFSKKITKKTTGKNPPGTALMEIALSTRRLWGRRMAPANGGQPSTGAFISPAHLDSWRKRSGVLLGIKALEAVPGSIRARLEASIPFLATRMIQSRNLPYLTETARDPTAEPAKFPECRSWPTGIEFDLSGTGPGLRGKPLSYFMTGPALKRGKPFVLLAFRNAGDMWGEYLSERLDGLLLESTVFEKRLKNLNNDILGPWGRVHGGQQIILRFSPRLLQRITRENRRAISMALNRKDIARAVGERRFSASRGFMDPLLPKNFRSGLKVLRWNTREARQEWVKNEDRPQELTLGVLDHPWLREIADRIQAHLNRTINLPLTITLFPGDQFQQLLKTWKTDMTLEVVDLEDGSLQNLWLTELEKAEQEKMGAVPDASPNTSSNTAPNTAKPVKKVRPPPSVTALEIEFQNRLPYLPLLINNHYVLVRKKPPPFMFWRICKGCQKIESPMELKKKKVRPLAEG